MGEVFLFERQHRIGAEVVKSDFFFQFARFRNLRAQRFCADPMLAEERREAVVNHQSAFGQPCEFIERGD